MITNHLKLFIIILLLIVGQQLLAQGPPNPPPNPSVGNEVVGCTAPIDSGLSLLLVLGATYGGKKLYIFRTNEAVMSSKTPDAHW